MLSDERSKSKLSLLQDKFTFRICRIRGYLTRLLEIIARRPFFSYFDSNSILSEAYALYLVNRYFFIVDNILNKHSEPGITPTNTPSKTDVLTAGSQKKESGVELIHIIVPLMLLFSSAIMATAWLGHLRYKEDLSFWMATLFAWFLVLPEYALNIMALRLGYRKFTGGQMGAFRLCTGVVCIAFVSHYILGEQLTAQKIVGFGIMAFSMILISSSDSKGVK